MPDHCFYSENKFPKENDIDFEVNFNLPYSKLTDITIDSRDIATVIYCGGGSWIKDTNLKDYGYKKYSGDTTSVVGISLNGVLFYSGLSELKYDAFYPPSYGTAVLVD